jgi:hypothetical protein
MADIVADLASKAGISPELAKKGLGAVLSFARQKLPQEAFTKVMGAVPGADGMMDAAESAEESSGGVMGAVGNLAGKIFGGSAGALISKLGQLGFSAEQVQRFVPAALEFIKNKLPPDVANKLAALLPAEKATAS